MNRTLRNTITLSIATLAVLGAGASPALAATPSPSPAHHSLADIQARAKAKTDARIASLDKAISRVNAAKHLTDADRTTILATLNGDVAGMNTVEAKIAGDTDASVAAKDYATIFTDYRVYAVAIPQSRLAAVADRISGATITRLTKAHDALAANLAAHPSKSTPTLVADLADMASQTAAGSSAVEGLAASSLAVTPDEYNANHDALSSERSAAKTAAAAVKKAAADGKAVRAALR